MVIVELPSSLDVHRARRENWKDTHANLTTCMTVEGLDGDQNTFENLSHNESIKVASFEL